MEEQGAKFRITSEEPGTEREPAMNEKLAELYQPFDLSTDQIFSFKRDVALPIKGRLNLWFPYTRKDFMLPVILLIVAFPLFFFKPFPSQRTTKTPAGTAAGTGTVKTEQNPDFKSLVPRQSDKSQDAILYDEDKKVASYEDAIAGERVVISQQKLEKAQLDDPLFLVKAAQSFGAKKELKSKKGQVFIMDNEELQRHVAIFVHKGILVFLQSEAAHTDVEWVDYINDLQ